MVIEMSPGATSIVVPLGKEVLKPPAPAPPEPLLVAAPPPPPAITK
jgi:hypothetical protein